MGMTFVRFFAMLTRSRPDLCENSTAYTVPSCPKLVSISMKRSKQKGDGTDRSDNVSDVGDGRSTRCAEVQDFFARCDVNVVETAQDACGQLRSERVPDAVFDLFGRLFGVGRRCFDGNTLFAVDGFAGDNVSSDEQVFFALCDKDACVTMRFEDDLGCAAFPGSQTGFASSSASPRTASSASRAASFGDSTTSSTATRCSKSATTSTTSRSAETTAARSSAPSSASSSRCSSSR